MIDLHIHTTYTDELITVLKKAEKKLNCDYHGSFKPRVDIGVGYGNLQISDKIIENGGI